jgi:hypothetical protein
MKDIRTILVCLFALMSFSNFCNGSESYNLSVEVTEDKVYIQLDSIYFSPNQIYVRIAEDLIPIQHLSCDCNGIFVSIQDIKAGKGRRDIWTCPKCGYENYDGINKCGTCGRDRYEKDGLNI